MKHSAILAGTGFPWGNQVRSAGGSVFAPPPLMTVTSDGLLASAGNLQASAQMASSGIENEALTDSAMVIECVFNIRSQLDAT